MATQKFFELIPNNKKVNFIRLGKVILPLTAIYIALSVFLCLTKGFNYSVDFKGGTQIHLKFSEAMDVGKIREQLEKLSVKDASVQEYGETQGQEFLIRVLPEDLSLIKHEAQFQKILSSLQASGKSANLRISEDRIYATFDQAVPLEQIQEAFAKNPVGEIKVDSVAPFGNADNHEYVVQFQGIGNRIVQGLKEGLGESKVEVLQIEQVGEKVGKELRYQALGALLIAMLLILVYVWFRFDFEFAPGAILSLVHDSVFVLGIFALFQLSFDLSIIAAVLTIVGFSVNDTIVIYDRIRENIKTEKGLSIEEIHNKSINETMSRTVLTSGTVFLATLALGFFGGPITRNFAIAFSVGILAGSYSTIFIASPLTIYLNRWQQRRKA